MAEIQINKKREGVPEKYWKFVDELLAVAWVDVTAPPQWRTFDLVSDIQWSLTAENDVEGFATVVLTVLEELIEPVCRDITALLRLAYLAGVRDCGDRDGLEKLCLSIGQEIGELDDGPRKRFCSVYLLFQKGLISARFAAYMDAVRTMETGANADTEQWLKAICRFLSHIYTAFHLLDVSGATRAKIDVGFLERELSALQQAVSGTRWQLVWGEHRGPFYLLETMMLSSVPDQDRGVWDRALSLWLANSSDNWSDTVFVLYDDMLKGKHDDVCRRGEGLLCADNPDFIRQWAHWILCRAYVKQGELSRASSFCAPLILSPKLNSGIVARVALLEHEELVHQAELQRGGQ